MRAGTVGLEFVDKELDVASDLKLDIGRCAVKYCILSVAPDEHGNDLLRLVRVPDKKRSRHPYRLYGMPSVRLGL